MKTKPNIRMLKPSEHDLYGIEKTLKWVCEADSLLAFGETPQDAYECYGAISWEFSVLDRFETEHASRH